ncbi:MAG TPA: CBS domain-containing protein, partial [Desulfuromonadales bacterium]|nr:CBS domain-containing protein [Desulfuromonadales bacterium]
MKLPRSPSVEDLSEIRKELSERDAWSVAEELAQMEPAPRAMVFRVLPKNLALDAFQYLEPAYQKELLEGLRDEHVRHLVEEMDPDDRARLFDEMPALVVKRLLAGLSPEQKEMTALLLGYPEESAGRIMTPQFIKLSAGMTIPQALDHFRSRSTEIETHYVMPVTDDEAVLVGSVEIKDLLLAPEGATIGEVMDSDPRSVRVDDDQEEVAQLIQSVDLLAVPVVDTERRVVGLVTVDDAMDVLSFEQSEDLALTGASEPLRRPYFSV